MGAGRRRGPADWRRHHAAADAARGHHVQLLAAAAQGEPDGRSPPAAPGALVGGWRCPAGRAGEPGGPADRPRVRPDPGDRHAHGARQRPPGDCPATPGGERRPCVGGRHRGHRARRRRARWTATTGAECVRHLAARLARCPGRRGGGVPRAGRERHLRTGARAAGDPPRRAGRDGRVRRAVRCRPGPPLDASRLRRGAGGARRRASRRRGPPAAHLFAPPAPRTGIRSGRRRHGEPLARRRAISVGPARPPDVRRDAAPGLGGAWRQCRGRCPRRPVRTAAQPGIPACRWSPGRCTGRPDDERHLRVAGLLPRPAHSGARRPRIRRARHGRVGRRRGGQPDVCGPLLRGRRGYRPPHPACGDDARDRRRRGRRAGEARLGRQRTARGHAARLHPGHAGQRRHAPPRPRLVCADVRGPRRRDTGVGRADRARRARCHRPAAAVRRRARHGRRAVRRARPSSVS